MDKKEAIDILKTNIEIQKKNIEMANLNFDNAKTALKTTLDNIKLDESPSLQKEIFPRAPMLDMLVSEAEQAKSHLLLLHRLLEYVEGIKEPAIYDLALDGLHTDGSHHKQWYLEEILKLLVTSEEYERLHDTWDEGVAP